MSFTSSGGCQCQYEIENGLRRTKYCFISCLAQGLNLLPFPIEHPIERLRNKLSPFLTLARMLADAENEIKPFANEKMNELLKHEIATCKENTESIRKYLADAEELLKDKFPE